MPKIRFTTKLLSLECFYLEIQWNVDLGHVGEKSGCQVDESYLKKIVIFTI